MEAKKAHSTEVWANLSLSADDCGRVRRFLIEECGITSRHVIRKMHITVYYSRRPMPGLNPFAEPAHLVVPAAETRFMVMYPGGENPRPELDPAMLTVGIRVQRQSAARATILEFRTRLTDHENRRVLGARAPSTDKSSAFGARTYQPHMSILRPGSEIDRDLKAIGERFRQTIGDLTFDRFVVDVVTKNGRKPPVTPPNKRIERVR